MTFHYDHWLVKEGTPSKWHLWIYQKTRLWYLEDIKISPETWGAGVPAWRYQDVRFRRNQNSPSLKLTKTPKIYQDVWLVSEDANIYLSYLESFSTHQRGWACENRLSGSPKKERISSSNTWRIIPLNKWLITMVSKSPKWGYSPSKWPKSLINRGY